MSVSGRISVIACALLIIGATIFHAGMVFLTNMPRNEIKHDAAALLNDYSGPQIAQSWSLFAPKPLADNIHVLVRGRSAEGVVTGWYDATKFFLVLMRSNRFTPTRSLAEGLAHSASQVYSGSQGSVAHAILIRTSAMVLRLYTKRLHIRSLQIELDAWPIPQYDSREVEGAHSKQLSWAIIPDVADLE